MSITPKEVRQIVREELAPLNHSHGILNKLLTGNGEPSKGIVVRLDRLEQVESGRRWWMRGAVSAVVSLVAERLWHLITGKG